eukprot:GHVN01022552.1.p1 GENE.GHVN01022552.1~~GHVN01022552.1.p1  ORF type:complete len:406 (+),score=38.08 GHVN01022552.1:556-1773(+)
MWDWWLFFFAGFVSVADSAAPLYKASRRGWNFVVFGCNSENLTDCFPQIKDANKHNEFFADFDVQRTQNSTGARELLLGEYDFIFASKYSKLRNLLNTTQVIQFSPPIIQQSHIRYGILVGASFCLEGPAFTTLRLLERGAATKVVGRNTIQEWTIRDLPVRCETKTVKETCVYHLRILSAKPQSFLQVDGTVKFAFPEIEEMSVPYGGMSLGGPKLGGPLDSLAAGQGVPRPIVSGGSYGVMSDLPSPGGIASVSPSGAFGPSPTSSGYGAMSNVPGGSGPRAVPTSSSGYGAMSIPTKPPVSSAPPAAGNNLPMPAPMPAPTFPGDGGNAAAWEFQRRMADMRANPLPMHIYGQGPNVGGYVGAEGPTGCTPQEYKLIYGIMCDLLDSILKKKDAAMIGYWKE